MKRLDRRCYPDPGGRPELATNFVPLSGGLLLGGENGLRALQLFGQGWPVVMIAIGVYLMLRRKDMTQD